MSFSWNTHVFSMAILKTTEEITRISHGKYLENPWVDITKTWPYSKLPWKLYGIDHEKSMEFVWISMGIPMDFL